MRKPSQKSGYKASGQWPESVVVRSGKLAGTSVPPVKPAKASRTKGATMPPKRRGR